MTISGVPAPQIRDNHAEGMRARDVRYRGELIGGGTPAAWCRLAGASVNLMQPSGGPSPWSDYLEANGPGGCYLAFAVPEVPCTLEALAALGYPTAQSGNTGGGNIGLDFLEPVGGASPWVSLMGADYERLFGGHTETLSALGDEERAPVGGGAAARVYKLASGS